MPHTLTHGFFDFVPALRRSRLQSDLLEQQVTLGGKLDEISKNKRSTERRKEDLDKVLQFIESGNIDFANGIIENNPDLKNQFGTIKLKGKRGKDTIVEINKDGKITFGAVGRDAQGVLSGNIVPGLEGDVATESPSLGVDRNAIVRELFPGRQDQSLTGPEIARVNERVQADREKLRLKIGAGEQKAKDESDFNRMAFFTQEGVQGIDQIVNTLQQSPEAFGTSGALAATTIGLVDQVVNLGKLFAPNFNISKNIEDYLQDTRDFVVGEISDDDFFEKSTKPFAQHFRDVGIKNRVIQSQLIGLATTLAAQEAIRGRGRLTQEAVRRQLELLGTRTQSPEAFAETLLNVRQRMIVRLRQQEEIIIKGKIPTFGPPPTVTTPIDAQAEADRFLQGR